MPLPLSRLARKVLLQFARRRLARELAEEMEAHAELKRSEHLRAGLPLADAAQQARRDMGNITLAVEQSNDVRTFSFLENSMQDLRHAFRLLRTNPGFTLAAILSLALAIGGNAAVFSVLNALLIKPLPFGNPDRLVRITEVYPKALLVYLREHSRGLAIGSASDAQELNIVGDGPAFRATASVVSANLFALLEVPVRLGRSFAIDEDQPGRDRVAILSHDLWTRQFSSDPNILGRLITVNGLSRRIVGIMPPGFAFPSTRVQLWIPAAIDPREPVAYWAGEFSPLIGRLHPGVSRRQAAEEIKSLARDMWTMFPWPMPRNWNANATVIPLQQDLAGEAQGRLWMLLSTVAAVLLIACSNIAGLLTARGLARSKELAMRAAVGAGRGSIIRQLLTESLLLALVAGTLGLPIGVAAVRLFVAVVPPDVPGVSHIAIDWHVVGFTFAISLLAGIFFGLAPAWSASRFDILQAIRAGGQRSAGTSTVRLRSWLIGGEIALTLILVSGAMLLLQNLYAFARANPGFQPQQLLAIKISPDRSFCKQESTCIAFYDRLLSLARSQHGIADAALANSIPFDGSAPALAVDVQDHPKTANFPAPMFWAGAVSPRYLQVMGIPLLAGRPILDTDSRTTEPVILLSASTARRFWPHESALGKHIKVASETRWRTVVGIVGDVRQFSGSDRAPSGITGILYAPYQQAVDAQGRIPVVLHLIAKHSAAETTAVEQLRLFIAGQIPNIPVSPAVSMEALRGNSLAGFRSTTLLLLLFASVGLTLAAIGIYGLVSYSVVQSRYDLALRMAIGASNQDILEMVLARSLRVTLYGLVAGLLGSFLVGRGFATLFDLAPTNPSVYGGVSIFLILVAMAASLLPAWHASHIDPVRVLRAE